MTNHQPFDDEFAIPERILELTAELPEQVRDEILREIENRDAALRLARQEATDVDRTQADAIVNSAWLVEQLHEAREEAERASRAKTSFLANMSQEIRTPLGGILGLVRLLRSGAHHDDSDKFQEWLSSIDNCGASLLELVNDVHDFSQIESGSLELEFKAFSPRAVACEVHDMLRPRAENKGLELDLVFEDGFPECVVSDSLRFRQVLVNLVSNAVKFTEYGSVEVRGGWSKGEGEGQIELLFEVCDTGVGIAEDRMETVFSPFTQADSSDSRRYGASGLGLAISERLVLALGGSLDVESQVGIGSTFFVAIPMRHEPVDLPARDDKQVVRGATRLDDCHVLIAEDYPINQLIARTVLEEAGATVRVVANGLEVLDAVDRESFDLVLMDMQMPEMDGYAATRQLRAQGVNLPVVAMTADAMGVDREREFRLGCDEYVSKPFEPETLIAVCARVLPER